MADAKKGKGGNQKKEQPSQPAPNVKESKEEVVAPTPAVAEPGVVINPNTNKPDPVVVPSKTSAKAPKKERVYQQGKGTVKAVLSGDTIVVLQMENGKPVEKEIQLTNIEAPKLGRRNKNERTNDEPFAFASREFLRKTVIGQAVSYTVEVKSGNEKGSREYGYVYVTKDGNQQDLAKILVGEGWCRVRRRPNKDGTAQVVVRPEVEELNKLEEEAINKKLGVHNKAGESKAVRPLDELSSMEAFEQNKKGAPIQAIVERVLSGSTLYLTLLPSLKEVRLTLSGVECPRTEPLEAFGREAKFCTEFFLLNRDVSVIFEGADKTTLYGTIDFRGNNISEELLKRGLAKYVEWSGARTAFVERLKAAEKAAKSKHLCVWEKYVEPKAESGKQTLKPGFVLQGKVTAIQTASVITVVDQTGKEYEVQLSSIKAPKGGKMKFKDEKEKKAEARKDAAKKDAEPKAKLVGEAPTTNTPKKPQLSEEERKDALERTYAWEAKEYLRKRLIGQRVKCVLDYIQTPEDQAKMNKGASKPGQDKTRYCYSVYVDNKNNVAVELCTQGLAQAKAHRGGDERSKDYEDMLKAETLATSQKRGQFKKPENATILVINDITGDKDLAAQHLASMARGRHRGIVQHVFHAGKYKLWVPNQNCELSVALSGVQTPKDLSTKDKPNQKEECYDEALNFVKDRIFQRDVEFEVNRVDKGGNFGGFVYVNKENLSTLLLAEGYGKLIDARAVKELPDYPTLKAAEDVAKRQRKNMWKNYDEEAERKKEEAENAEREGKREAREATRYMDVIVTEIVDAQNFYVQLIEDAAKLDELMKGLSLDDVPAASEPFKAGDVVRAQYSADDTWYRATITSVDGSNYKVLYVDYGNSETIPASRIKAISPKHGKDTLAYQAKKAHLAFVQAPSLDQDYGQDAAEVLRELVENKQLSAQEEYSHAENDDLYLSLMDGNTHLGAVLVREGLARVKKPRGRDWKMSRRNKEYQDKLVAELLEQEKNAKEQRLNVWRFGDYASDDEEDRGPRGGKKEKKKASTTSSPATTKKDK